MRPAVLAGWLCSAGVPAGSASSLSLVPGGAAVLLLWDLVLFLLYNR